MREHCLYVIVVTKKMKKCYLLLLTCALRAFRTYYRLHYDISLEFIPPKLPWWRGFYEKLVGITKMSLKKVVGKVGLSYDELVNVICEVENSTNSHPLTHLTDEN